MPLEKKQDSTKDRIVEIGKEKGYNVKEISKVQ